LTKQEREELDRLLRANPTFSEWYKTTIPAYYGPARHIDYICRIIDQVVSGDLRRVTLSMPPGHAKTDTVTVRLPIYWGLRNPNDAIVFTGYNQEFAEKNLSRPTRNLADDLGVLDKSSNAMSDWHLKNGARLVARGVGNAPTGINPISLLVCDDPINSREQAESEAIRNIIWDWWTGSIVQRFWPQTRVFVIATRWHEDDLIGRIKAEGDPSWTHINLPAIATEDDVLGRLPGEALWPEQKPVDFLEAQRAEMGDYNFQSLFQGSPTARGGSLFQINQFKFISEAELPPMVYEVRKWDIAASVGKGDYTAGVKIGRDAEGRYYVLDCVRFQEGTDERNKKMLLTAKWDGTKVKIIVPEDPGSAGKDQALGFIRMFSGYKVTKVRETGSKTTRADTFASQVNAGNVTIVKGAWNRDYVEEHRTFPNGKNDDMVDASSGAFSDIALKFKKQLRLPTKQRTYI
jgi:predicted phage terminase large subunit-like protein